MLGVADPRVEACADPATGVQVVEQLLGGVLSEKVGYGRGHDIGARVELGVQGVEEVVAVARVELPRVLAVQGDDREKLPVPLDIANPPEARDQITRRVDG